MEVWNEWEILTTEGRDKSQESEFSPAHLPWIL
jgi:hypothetical protein